MFGAVRVNHRKQSGACKLLAGMLLLGMTSARLPVHHVKPTPSTTMLQRYQVICSYHIINNSFFTRAVLIIIARHPLFHVCHCCSATATAAICNCRCSTPHDSVTGHHHQQQQQQQQQQRHQPPPSSSPPPPIRCSLLLRNFHFMQRLQAKSENDARTLCDMNERLLQVMLIIVQRGRVAAAFLLQLLLF